MLTIPQASGLGPREYEIMQIMWAHDGPLTVKQVRRALSDRELAYTTIMTTMSRLAAKGVLNRAPCYRGGQLTYAYAAAVSRTELLAAAVEQICVTFGADGHERQSLAAAIQHAEA